MKNIVSLIVAVFLVALCVAGCGGGGDTVTVTLLNWGEYLEPSLIAQFESENPGIKINQTFMTSNEEMYSVCATEGSEIDIVVPSDYVVERFMNEGLLAEINYDNIPNFQYVAEYAKTRTFDPESKYSVPYMMGTVGIVYNTTMVDDVVDSWDILWNEKYQGKIMMYDSIRDSLMVALCRLGYDINTTDAAQIQEATQMLIAQKPLVLAYGTDDIKEAMIAGSAAMAVDYSGAAAAAIAENADLNYIVPKEGSNVWVDNLVIMKNCPEDRKAAAEKFINFLCDPEVTKTNAEYIGYTTPNAEAMKLMDAEMLANPAFVMKEEDVSRCAYYKDLGENVSLYNDAWQSVKKS